LGLYGQRSLSQCLFMTLRRLPCFMAIFRPSPVPPIGPTPSFILGEIRQQAAAALGQATIGCGGKAFGLLLPCRALQANAGRTHHRVDIPPVGVLRRQQVAGRR